MFKNPWTSLIVFAVIKIATLVFIHKSLEVAYDQNAKRNPDLYAKFTTKK